MELGNYVMGSGAGELEQGSMGPGNYCMSIWDGLEELWDRSTAWSALTCKCKIESVGPGEMQQEPYCT